MMSYSYLLSMQVNLVNLGLGHSPEGVGMLGHSFYFQILIISFRIIVHLSFNRQPSVEFFAPWQCNTGQEWFLDGIFLTMFSPHLFFFSLEIFSLPVFEIHAISSLCSFKEQSDMLGLLPWYTKGRASHILHWVPFSRGLLLYWIFLTVWTTCICSVDSSFFKNYF